MRDEYENEFKDNYPQFFADLHGDPMKTAMSSLHGGIAVCDGWYELLKKLCEDLSKVAGPNFKFVQIKEKFGQLRIYAGYGNSETEKLIDEAEAASAKICEYCGTENGVTLEGRWIKALCSSCREVNKNK